MSAARSDPTVPAGYFVSPDAAMAEVAAWRSAQHTRTYDLGGELVTVDIESPDPMLCPFDGGVLVRYERSIDGEATFEHLHGHIHSNRREYLRAAAL